MSTTVTPATTPSPATSAAVHAGLTHNRWAEIVGPTVVVIAAALGAAAFSESLRFLTSNTLALLAMVLALQVFIGNSGVLSFGHGAFALLGGFTTGLLTMTPLVKENVLSDLFPFLQSAHTSMIVSLILAVVVGTVVSGILGLFLMRLSGLAAGIATFAVLMVSDNVFFNSQALGPGPQVMPQIPRFGSLAIPIALAVAVLAVAYFAGNSRPGRLLRGSREDHLASRALGVSVWWLRVQFFALSGGLAALAGAMYAHHAAAIRVRDFYLDFTFTTLAMLVIGGSGSVWGAVVGTLAVTTIGQVLLELETGLSLGPLDITIPNGSRGIVIAAAMVVMLLWRPTGLTGGREFRLPKFLSRR